MADIEREMRALEEQIAYHSKKYYDEDAPEISDYDYDMLFLRLKNLESMYPEYASPVSPTIRVGGHVAERFEKYSHPVRLGSLTDVFDLDGINAFVTSVQDEFSDVNFCVERKIDGLSVALEYIDGVFTLGATRGNGLVGENVTHNLKTVRSIPLKISKPIPHLIVRGEVYMPKKTFAKLNEVREEDGLSPFANPRNAAAGSLRQLDSSLCAKRGLDIFVFNVQLCSEPLPENHSDCLDYMKELGFTVSPGFKVCGNYDEVSEKIKEIGDTRKDLPFDIDGAVVKVNQLSRRAEMGDVGAVPRWAVAYKYPPETVLTTVKDIAIQVGRTGVLTPKAVLEPVKLAGSTVSAATLHNIDYIKEKDIRVGDTVVLHKAGDIIPEIVEVDLSKRKNNSAPFEMPETCPSCGEKVYRENDEAAVRCTNSACPAQLCRNIVHFVSKPAMDIEYLGEETVSRFIDEKMLDSVTSLYSLSKDKIACLDGMGEKSAENILSAIEESKKRPLSKLIYALGIRHIGEKAARTLAKKYGSMENFMKAGFEDLTSIPDVGQKMAESITEFFSVSKNAEMISELSLYGVNMIEEVEITGNIFEGKTIVVTGKLVSFTREEIEDAIMKNGGKAASSVSKKTSFVVCGENAGSKLAKANELGIPVLAEDEFKNMLSE